MDRWSNVDDNMQTSVATAASACAYLTLGGDPCGGSAAIRSDLDPPVKGRFENGVGTFTPRPLRGKPMRFMWSKITPTSAHWEQAFSPRRQT